MNLRKECAPFFKKAQDEICRALEDLDNKSKFVRDHWQRTDVTGEPGGGGVTGILTQGDCFEQAGVNFSEVHGFLPPEMSKKLVGSEEKAAFYATGISVVIHPFSPMLPTSHANFRYLEVGDKHWFGGGMDLTPYYLFEEDAQHFHRRIRSTCDLHHDSFYPKFKKWCDQYFYLAHRNETRGVGGIFFDYVSKDDDIPLPSAWSFVQDLPRCFLEAYLPICNRRKTEFWGEKEKAFQLIRRGRYVEFNLLYDRGTQFGLSTGGRTESILMSLPPVVHWKYSFAPEPNSREEKLIQALRNPREWCEV